eukprot:gb/GFBE01021100.1/.p1 GENE.gb/GFBE01021100.1/~~gb/GFBE01021100.1/.p1  ORF type:complete len:365 (+),score=59.50 gb/GFBE01021100.1/:1-1095(+)
MFGQLKFLACLVLALVAVASGAAGIADAARAAIAASSASVSAVPEASRGAESAWAHQHASATKAPLPARHPNLAAHSSSSAQAPNSSVAGVSAESAAGSRGSAPQAAAAGGSNLPTPDAAAPEPPEMPESEGWEACYAWGLYHSKMACLAGEHSVGSWAFDNKGSKAGVPQLMLRAEELLASASEEAPKEQQRSKLAERALRLYYHGKWLAERNHATAAEWRYREASRLARLTRRNVLAAHALGRLGYFLMHWRRMDEAKEVLQESRRVSSKSNPLAPYLLGLLERQAAGPDAERLLAAEDMIISAGEQPSPDLEAERVKMMQTIEYWRNSEASAMKCLDTADAAHVIICLFGHLFMRVTKALA